MFKKNDVKLKVASTVLAGSFVGAAVSGCGLFQEKESVLDDTILENTVVVTFSDNTKDIATPFATNEGVNAYKSVISEVYYYSSDEEVDIRGYQKYDINNVEQISSYLVEEDIGLLRNKDKKNDAIYGIIGRDIDSNQDAVRTR